MCWEYSSRLISSLWPQISQQDQTDWAKLRFYVLWVLFIGSTSSTMTGFGLWDSTKSCIVCVGLMYDEPLLIYEVFIWMSVSIFVELGRTLQRGASLASVECRTEEPLVLKCYCTRKKVWPQVLPQSNVEQRIHWCWNVITHVRSPTSVHLNVSDSILHSFSHLPMMLVIVSFTILTLTVYLWCRIEEPLVLK